MTDSRCHLFTLKESDQHDVIRKAVIDYLWSNSSQEGIVQLLDHHAIDRCLYLARYIDDRRLVAVAILEGSILRLAENDPLSASSLTYIKTYLASIPSDKTLRQEIIGQTSHYLAQLEAKPIKHKDWPSFHQDFITRFPNFLHNLHIEAPNLTPTYVRICQLYAVGYQAGEIQRMFNIVSKSLVNYRYEIRKQLGLRGGKQTLEMWLVKLLLASK